MKKSILFIILIALSFSSFSQFNFGVKGGVNFNSINISTTGWTADNPGFGYAGGLFVRMSTKKLYLQPEALISGKNYIYTYSPITGADTTFNSKALYLDVPVQFGWRKVFKKLTVGTGPVFSFLLSENIDVNINGSSSIINVDKVFDKTYLGWHLDAGLELGRIMLGCKYEFSLGEVISPFSIPGSGTQFSPSAKGNLFQLTLGFKFLPILD